MSGGYRGAAFSAVLVLASVLGGTPVADGGPAVVSGEDAAGEEDNEAPLADAGLDQEVPVNATVYLDATGSRDPDGRIESYEWSIERPDGNHIEPACATCARTEFQVTMNGTYNVTVTVTDDDGATNTDTLYVQANAVEGPSVEIAGPTDVTANTSATYTATAEGGESSLMRVEWKVDGTEVADREMSGDTATDDLRRSLDPGTHEVTVRVVTEMGRTGMATLTVDVADQPDRPCAGATWNGTRGAWDTDPCDGDDGPSDGPDDDTTAEACYNDQSEDAQRWENANPTEEYGCQNDRILGDETPSIRDSTGDGTLQIGNFTLTESQIERFVTRNDGVTLESGSGFGTIEFASQEAYREAIGTNYITHNGVSEADITLTRSLIENPNSESEEHERTNSHSAEVLQRIPERYSDLIDSRDPPQRSEVNSGGSSGRSTNSGGSASGNSGGETGGSSSSNSGGSSTGTNSSGGGGGSNGNSSTDGGGRVPDRYQQRETRYLG